MLYTSLLLVVSAAFARAAITQNDFKGKGRINVLLTDNLSTANPQTATVGCLNNSGKFINSADASKCGVFNKAADYPYHIYTSVGNCTFSDPKQPANNDSIYGKGDFAYTCDSGHAADINDDLYTIDGFNYVFLCFGDVACFYDAKHTPAKNEVLLFWQYRWGSQQLGITPGHVQIALQWKGISSTAKREDSPSESYRGPEQQN